MTRTKRGGLLRSSILSNYLSGVDIIDTNFSVETLPKDVSSSTDYGQTKQIKEREFVTGSKFIGECGTLGMTGIGRYTMPHGVYYEGVFNAGNFEQMGTLYYPNGARIEGFWFAGKLVWSKYHFSDNLMYHHQWRYCKMPDRRFYTEVNYNLSPYDVCQLTNEVPHRIVPSGCYDTGDGFYNPKTKCVTHPITGKILRIPTKTEEEWIIENCRKGDEENVGFRKDLYENWFDDVAEGDNMTSLQQEMPVFERIAGDAPSHHDFYKSESSATWTGTQQEDFSVQVSQSVLSSMLNVPRSDQR